MASAGFTEEPLLDFSVGIRINPLATFGCSSSVLFLSSVSLHTKPVTVFHGDTIGVDGVNILCMSTAVVYGVLEHFGGYYSLQPRPASAVASSPALRTPVTS